MPKALIISMFLAFSYLLIYRHVLYCIHDDIEGDIMSIIHQKDKRSGITYVYECKSFWDKEKKQSRSKRTLIGRLNEETGEIIPTDGRCKKRSPNYVPSPDDYEMPKTMKGLRDEVKRLIEENTMLKQEIKELKSKKTKRISDDT